jgi:hypothetical protein
LLLILLVLVGLAVRLDAAPAADSIALARRYADILTGEEPDDDVRGPDDANDSAATDRAGTARTDDEAADGDAEDGAWRATTGDEDAPVAGAGAADGDAAMDGDSVANGGGGRGGEPGVFALLDAEQAPPDAAAIEAARTAAASAGSTEAYESWMRRLRPSLWGRLDVGVSWRRRWSQPRYAPAQRHDEVWLFATWRR